MDWDSFQSIIRQVHTVQRLADNMANEMAGLLIGRLHAVGGRNLAALKREIAGYNIHTGRWRN